MDTSVRSINSDTRLLLKSKYTSRIIRVEPFVYSVPVCGSAEGAVSNKLDKKERSLDSVDAESFLLKSNNMVNISYIRY